MRDYRPLLLQTLDVRLPGLHLRRLRLNRHLPEADALDEHQHAFSQTLCYLSGRGTLRARGGARDVLPGATALVPGGVAHGFRETAGRRPLALAIDFDLRGAPKAGFRTCQLNQSESSRIRHHLSEISRIKNPAATDSRLLAASAALAILDIQLRALGILPGRPAFAPPFVKKFERLVADPATALLPIAELAARAGYQPDYLNRRHKQATGLTLVQQRNQVRLAKAKRLLAQGLPVSGVASGAGFDDPNYFTRWFKRQTGVPPRTYRG